MHPNILFSCLEQNSCGNKRSRRAAASATRGWHDDSLPGAGFLYNSVPLDSVGWHDDYLSGAWFAVQFGASGFRRVARRFPRQRLGSRRADEHRPRLTSADQTCQSSSRCLCRGRTTISPPAFDGATKSSPPQIGPYHCFASTIFASSL